MVTLGESLARVTVTPPLGAGPGRVTWKAADWPRFSDTPEGRPIVPALWTVTLVVAFATFGTPVLVETWAVPALAPLMVTWTALVPCAMVTLGGTVTIPRGFAVRFTTRAEGAVAESVRVRVSLSGPVRVDVDCEKLSEAATFTVSVSDV